MHDLGFRAQMRGAERGFRVQVGGGTAIMCKSASVLHDFVPAAQIFNVTEAIIRVFHKFGDYKHKQRNRMKFLMKSLGWDRWQEEYQRALGEFIAEGGASLPFDPERPPVEQAPAWRRAEAPSILETVSRASSSQLTGPGIGRTSARCCR